MKTGEQLTDRRTGIGVVVLASAADTDGIYALVEIALPGGLRTEVVGPDPLPRVELEILHGALAVDGRTLRAGEQLVLAPGERCTWLVPAGRGAVLLLEVRPGAQLRAVVRMLVEPH